MIKNFEGSVVVEGKLALEVQLLQESIQNSNSQRGYLDIGQVKNFLK